MVSVIHDLGRMELLLDVIVFPKNGYIVACTILVGCVKLHMFCCDFLDLQSISSYGGMIYGLFYLFLLASIFVIGLFVGIITFLRGIILVGSFIFSI